MALLSHADLYLDTTAQDQPQVIELAPSIVFYAKQLTHSDAANSKQIKLPKNEVKGFAGELRHKQSIILAMTDRAGTIWSFVCTCYGCQYALSKVGDFAKAYNLKAGDVLIFYSDDKQQLRIAVNDTSFGPLAALVSSHLTQANRGPKPSVRRRKLWTRPNSGPASPEGKRLATSSDDLNSYSDDGGENDPSRANGAQLPLKLRAKLSCWSVQPAEKAVNDAVAAAKPQHNKGTVRPVVSSGLAWGLHKPQPLKPIPIWQQGMPPAAPQPVLGSSRSLPEPETNSCKRRSLLHRLESCPPFFRGSQQSSAVSSHHAHVTPAAASTKHAVPGAQPGWMAAATPSQGQSLPQPYAPGCAGQVDQVRPESSALYPSYPCGLDMLAVVARRQLQPSTDCPAVPAEHPTPGLHPVCDSRQLPTGTPLEEAGTSAMDEQGTDDRGAAPELLSDGKPEGQHAMQLATKLLGKHLSRMDVACAHDPVGIVLPAADVEEAELAGEGCEDFSFSVQDSWGRAHACTTRRSPNGRFCYLVGLGQLLQLHGAQEGQELCLGLTEQGELVAVVMPLQACIVL